MKNVGILVCIVMVCMGCNNTTTSQTKLNADTTDAKTTISKAVNATAEKSNVKNNVSKNTQDDWYWKNTQLSKNNAFENWEHGAVDLVMFYGYKNNTSTPETFKVGRIDANGAITINLPETIQTKTILGNLHNLIFYDIQDVTKFVYTNPEASYFGKTSIRVEKNGSSIGNLTLGNSVRVTYNLVNQSTLTMGDEGYLISWVYLDRAARMQGTEETNNTIRRDGTKTIEAENTVVYALDYKKGWNLVKTEVVGKYELEHERGLNASWFKKHEHTVLDVIPSDANYYFRKLNH